MLPSSLQKFNLKLENVLSQTVTVASMTREGLSSIVTNIFESVVERYLQPIMNTHWEQPGSVDITPYEIVIRTTASAAAGFLIGLDRAAEAKPGGIATHVFVAVGAVVFTLAGLSFHAYDDPSRVASQVSSDDASCFNKSAASRLQRANAALWTVDETFLLMCADRLHASINCSAALRSSQGRQWRWLPGSWYGKHLLYMLLHKPAR
jgi:MgtC family